MIRLVRSARQEPHHAPCALPSQSMIRDFFHGCFSTLPILPYRDPRSTITDSHHGRFSGLPSLPYRNPPSPYGPNSFLGLLRTSPICLAWWTQGTGRKLQRLPWRTRSRALGSFRSCRLKVLLAQVLHRP